MADQAKSKKSAPKKPAAHPTYIDMITAAIGALKERNGSSRQAIAKYILANYKVDATSMKTHLRMALKRGVDNKKLVQPKGTGASGSFKLNQAAAKADAAAKAKKEKAKKKAAADKEKKAAKKATKKPKKPAAKKAKKPAAKKATKSPKKAKKSEKKASKPKKASKSPKKPKSKKPKKPKAKKASKSPKKAAKK
ncbi:histone H1.1, embryonic-like [Anneissia japonica]|uniref:histone H1.1, embryonic-like n=1 Tax=Anneissia japonica TaxID=1529436 RepID=UPI0014254D08|nr:histone H1.1, embryonic-like [Anneissia japonica]